MYAVSVAHTRGGGGRGRGGDSKHVVYEDYNFNVTRREFVAFMKFYNKDFTDVAISDIFMYLNKRLQTLMNTDSRRMEDDLDTSLDKTYDKFGNTKNKDLMGGSPGLKQKEEKLEYGLNK